MITCYFLPCQPYNLAYYVNEHAFIWFSHSMTVLALQQKASFLLEMLFSLYYASSNFGRTYLSQDFGWISTQQSPSHHNLFHFLTLVKKVSLSSEQCTCYRKKMGTILIQKGAFFGTVLSIISKLSFDTCTIQMQSVINELDVLQLWFILV